MEPSFSFKLHRSKAGRCSFFIHFSHQQSISTPKIDCLDFKIDSNPSNPFAQSISAIHFNLPKFIFTCEIRFSIENPIHFAKSYSLFNMLFIRFLCIFLQHEMKARSTERIMRKTRTKLERIPKASRRKLEQNSKERSVEFC